VIPAAPTQSDLLGMWERGEGQPVWQRALVLLGNADEANTLPIGRRDALLLVLRERLFGNTFTGVTSCPSCAEEIELTFDSSEVRRDAAEPPASFLLSTHGYELGLRLPRTSDVACLADAPDLAAARATLFARCMISATYDGRPVDVMALPGEVLDAAAAAMAKLDPQADVTLDMTCPSCAHAWLEPFDVVTFLWTELAATARRALRDVHRLASAYGWSEREILALSPPRRNAYLEMVG
jgi:hypothetical protein